MLHLPLHPLQYSPKKCESLLAGLVQLKQLFRERDRTSGFGNIENRGVSVCRRTDSHIRRWLRGKFLAHCTARDGLVAQKGGQMQVRLFQVSWEFDKPCSRQEAQPVHSLLQNSLYISSNAFTHLMPSLFSVSRR